MEILDRVIIKDCIDVGFDIGSIKSRPILDIDDIGNIYHKTINYMDDTLKINKYLERMLWDKGQDVRKILDYIYTHLGYNEINIILNCNYIASLYEKTYATNLRKAIKTLCSLNVIRKISDYHPNSILPKNTYSVNFNYICNGNIKEIKSEIEKQRKKQIINQNINSNNKENGNKK